MVYITGDTHADFSRFATRRFPEQKQLTKDDLERQIENMKLYLTAQGKPFEIISDTAFYIKKI